jgi:Undecaprenyl-phosphate glucose phosphotransferase
MGEYVDNALPARNLGTSVQRRRVYADIVTISTDALILWDILSVCITGYLCAEVYIHLFARPRFADAYLNDLKSLSVFGGVLAAFVLRRAAQGGTKRGRSQQSIPLIAVMQATVGRVFVLVALLLSVIFLTRSASSIPRIWMTTWVVAILATAVGSRLAIVIKLRSLEAQGLLLERIAVVGPVPIATQVIARLRRERGPAVELTAVYEVPGGIDHPDNATKYAQLVELGKQQGLDWVILAMPAPAQESLRRAVHELKALDVQVALWPQTAFWPDEFDMPEAEISNFHNVPVVLLADRPINGRGLLAKELIDKVMSALAIGFLAPLFIAIAIAIRLDSPGPIIFRQKRHGRNNIEFDILKFRTMYVTSPEVSNGRLQTRRNDSRITAVGSFLRKSSLDELPQLFNVLRGEMSLVGPRPHPCEMRTEDRLSDEISAEYAHRHRVKPGITGWAQINGHRGATDTAEQVRQRVECDLYYIQNWSLPFDLWILLLTPIRLAIYRDNAF